MAEKKSKAKSKRTIPLRDPGAQVAPLTNRPSLLLFDEVKRLEDLGMLKPEESVEQISVESDFQIPDTEVSVGSTTKVSTRATLPRQTSHTRQTSQTFQTEIAPTKNYQKVPNSITREAIPSGVFKGKSKQLYDVLYSLTRGAIVPTRTVRIRKTELMKRSAIGARVTFDSNIAHLQQVGLISETVYAGEHAGNEFEVFTFDEIGTLTSMPSMSSMPSQSGLPSMSGQTSHAQKRDTLVSLETSQTRQGLNDDSAEDYRILKTLFKDFKIFDDDAPLGVALRKLNVAARELTGKELTKKDWEAFAEIIELVVNETAIAATRTGQVSVYMKFATENLRRRLYKKAATKKSTQKVYEPGSSQPAIENVFETEALGENREMVLKNFREMVKRDGREAIEIFAGNYLPEDWKWISENLEERKN
jgi:hypothetical protein